jgi:uncharacterized protein
MPVSYRAAQNLIKRGDEAGLRAALASGLDPNLANNNGWSLLMLAAVEGALPLGRLLLDKGAAVEATNRHGETALSLAAHKGHIDYLRMLRESGASTACTPHGTGLAEWLREASGLPEARLAEVLAALS